jgi:hypothetical protein
VLTYLQALLFTSGAAADAKDQLLRLKSAHVHRAFVIRRDQQGYHVDGRFHGERPQHGAEIFFAAVSRLFHRSSREEDSVAVNDAEQELAVGQSALVALIDESPAPGENATDNLIHAAGGTIVRVTPGTLDAEDHERFFAASSLTDASGEPYGP